MTTYAAHEVDQVADLLAPEPEGPSKVVAGLAVVALVAAACGEVLAAAGQLREASLIDLVKGPDLARLDLDALTRAEDVTRATFVVRVALLVLAFALTGWFCSRVTRALRDERVEGLRHGTAMAGWGWIIPFVSFVFPLQIMNDLLHGSARTESEMGRRDWVTCAWIALVASNLSVFIASAGSTNAGARRFFAVMCLLGAVALLLLALWVLLVARRWTEAPVAPAALLVSAVAALVVVVGTVVIAADIVPVPDSAQPAAASSR